MEIINLNMTPSTVTPNAHAGQYDASRTVRFMLKNGGVPFTLAGTETITAEITRSDNTEVTVNVENTSSNYVDVVFDDAVCTVKGLYACELRLKDSDGFDIGSKNFALLVQRDPHDGAGVHVETVGPADICTFETTLPEPLQSVIVDIEATGGNGTPDSPIPVNGYTEANIVNTQNKSIVDLFSIDSDFRGTVDFNQQANIIDGTTTESSVTITKSGGKITTSGTATANINYLLNSFDAYSGHKYLIMNMDNVASFPTYYLLFKGDVGIYDVPKIVNLTSDITATFRMIINSGQTPDANFYPQIYDLTQMFGATIADYIYSLEQNNAGAGVAFFRSIYPDSYYPYDIGTTELVGKETPEATIAFGQTVYGGVLDVTRGKLTVNKMGVTYDGSSDENWVLHGSGSASAFAMRSNIVIDNINIDAIPMSNYLKGISRNATWGDHDNWVSVTSGKQIVTGIQSITDVDSWKTYLSNNPLQVAYELATPFDIDLTPEVISAVVGTNNVFADCGQTTVKYLKAE